MHYSDLIKLLQIDGVGRKTIIRLKNTIENNGYSNLSFKDYIDIMSFDLNKTFDNVKYDHLQIETEKILEKCYNENINIMTCFENDFSEIFANMGDDMPPILYLLGNKSIIGHKNNIAVIGTRNPSSNGYNLGLKYSEFISGHGANIISGLAEGCDTAAHNGALLAKGSTLATLPSGLGFIYPKSNFRLYHDILDNNGCIISENTPMSPPQKFHFIDRDRLQAALSKGVLIIESSLNSGTRHTYNYSLIYNKSIAASMHDTGNPNNLNLNKHIQINNTGQIIKKLEDIDVWLHKIQQAV